jgi:hypothetical protein
MTSRRGDALYFGLFAAALAVAVWIGGREEEIVAPAPIDFSLPGIEFDVPFAMPFARVEFKRAEAPRLALGGDTERVIVQVRRNLLESSFRDGDDVEVSIEVPEGGDVPSGLSAQERQLAAAFD